ncbi:MAG: serine/threonine-protein kinase [Propionibacteriales bacterium]|nr:serine/threonine-protein kinase [Propionibacteriales bacterium]
MSAQTSGTPAPFADRFVLGPLLGSGGSSAAYRATDLVTGAPVALKVLHPHLCGTAAARAAFLAEAERLAAARHPNIAVVHDFGVDDASDMPLAWIALELIEGPSLDALIRQRGALPLTIATEVMTGVLDGLAAAHSAGLVHRDISPANVLLRAASKHPTADDVRLIDFGLAEQSGRNTVGSELLTSHLDPSTRPQAAGSVGYVSPEQALGQPVTPSGDIYQAGAVLYLLVTGEPPFRRPSAAATVRAHLSAPPPVPSAVMPSARALDDVVTTAMAKRPEDRFADAVTFREALRRAQRTAPPPTRVLPSVPPQLGRSARPAGFTGGLDYLNAPATAPATSKRGRPPKAPPTGSAAPLAAIALLALAAVAVATATSSHPQLQAMPPALPASATATPSPSAAPSPPPTVVVPLLPGSLGEAEAALSQVGLRLGKVTQVLSAEPAGTVLRQRPAAGSAVAVGAAVQLTVASGNNAVPAVSGLSVAAASAVLESSGFTLADASRELGPDEVVSESQPAVGTSLRLGVAVTLVVALEPSPSPSPA